MPLRTYLIRRIIYSIILLLLVIIVNYAIFMLMPGDPTSTLLSGFSRESPTERMEHERLLNELWGLNDPPEIQLLKYIRNLLMWDFGRELLGRRPIQTVMLEKIPFTVLLLGCATAISLIIGIALGVYAVSRRGGLFDSISVVTALVLNSLPTFWLGLILLWVFSSTLHWLPGSHAFPAEWAGGKAPVPFSLATSSSPQALGISLNLNVIDVWNLFYGYFLHLLLPLMTLTLFSFGGWLLLTRACMLDAITEDYVVTARAKGLSERSVLFKHALKNASLPLITSAALSFAFILTGAIITETVFSYPGVGGWLWDAISFHDYSVLMAIFYVSSLAVIIANIIADLLYGIIDPRIKFG
ncbi:MAG: ABC transporter permease [Candidatus Jordarchaeaceae archaeon]